MIYIDTIKTWIGQALSFFDNLTGNYIIAMILFAIIVEIILIPFGIKQQKNSIKQAKLRPKEMAIRNKYKGRDDAVTKQKMQQEVTELYQKENFNPMSGCLPLLIQLPIILILWSVITNPLQYVVGLDKAAINGDDGAVTIHSVIEDYNKNRDEKDQIKVNNKGYDLYYIEAIREIGTERFSQVEGFSEKIKSEDDLPDFNVLGQNFGKAPSDSSTLIMILIPALVFLFQFASSKLMRKFTYQAPSTQDANMGCSNSMMDITMPLMTTFFAFSMPCAIGVYWIAKNILTFGKQMLLTKLMPVPKFTEEDYKAAEKELNAKTPKNNKSVIGSSGRAVRSLHHIDDEDFEDTREKALAHKAKLEAQEKEEAEKAKAERSILGGAKIKADKKSEDEKKEETPDIEDNK